MVLYQGEDISMKGAKLIKGWLKYAPIELDSTCDLYVT